MIKNHPNILSNGKALNRRQGHPTLVILAMNDFSDQRFVSPSNHRFSFLASVLLSISIDMEKRKKFVCNCFLIVTDHCSDNLALTFFF